MIFLLSKDRSDPTNEQNIHHPFFWEVDVTNNFPKPIDERSTVSTELDRKAFVRDWIARRLKAGKIAGSGFVATLLTLPVLAAAEAGDAFVTASQIEGVTDVEAMPDGSAQLRMSNGTTISVPASDVQVAASGEVLVSDRIVEIAAEVDITVLDAGFPEQTGNAVSGVFLDQSA